MLTLVEMQMGGSKALPSLSEAGSIVQSTAETTPESSGRNTLSSHVVSGDVEPPQLAKKPLIEPSISPRRDSWMVGDVTSFGSVFSSKADLSTSAGRPSFELILSLLSAAIIELDVNRSIPDLSHSLMAQEAWN